MRGFIHCEKSPNVEVGEVPLWKQHQDKDLTELATTEQHAIPYEQQKKDNILSSKACGHSMHYDM